MKELGEGLSSALLTKLLSVGPAERRQIEAMFALDVARAVYTGGAEYRPLAVRGWTGVDDPSPSDTQRDGRSFGQWRHGVWWTESHAKDDGGEGNTGRLLTLMTSARALRQLEEHGEATEAHTKALDVLAGFLLREWDVDAVPSDRHELARVARTRSRLRTALPEEWRDL